MKTIGAIIRESRQGLGMTQAQLAKKAGLCKRALESWERGERMPSLPGLLSLADALDMSLDALVGRERRRNT